eukprot:11625812-Karenia_brevis.AAC.1
MGDKGKGKGKGIKGNCWGCGQQGHRQDQCPKGKGKGGHNQSKGNPWWVGKGGANNWWGGYGKSKGKGKGMNNIENEQYGGWPYNGSWEMP